MVKFLTVSEYAAHRGIVTQTVYDLITRGKIPETCLEKKGRYIRIDQVKADKELEENLDRIINTPKPMPSKSKGSFKRTKKPGKAEISKKIKQAGMDGLTLAEAQRVQAQYKAALLELDYNEKSNRLVKLEKVEMDFFNIARKTRDALLNIPGRISSELASSNDPHFVNNRITEEITQALEELSR